MANFLRNFFGDPDEEYDNVENNQEAVVNNSNGKVVAMHGPHAVKENSKIALYQPRLYSDVQEIADELLANRAVIINFTQMDSGEAKRLIDFLNGTVYAIDGNIKRIGEQIFLCTPRNFDVEGELSTQASTDQASNL